LPTTDKAARRGKPGDVIVSGPSSLQPRGSASGGFQRFSALQSREADCIRPFAADQIYAQTSVLVSAPRGSTFMSLPNRRGNSSLFAQGVRSSRCSSR
jgi:hypothetical protein